MLTLSEADVRDALSMAETIAAVEGVLARWGEPAVRNFPRLRVGGTSGGGEPVGMNILPAMAATGEDGGFFGLKSYAVGVKGAGHLVTLYSVPDGRIAAVIEARHLGAMRTGAISAVATRILHGPTRSLACIGAGAQAEAQILALAEGNALDDVTVYSRTAKHSEALAERLASSLEGVRLTASRSAAEAVEGADVVCTITRAERPVVTRAQLGSGTHINAAGSNSLDRQEIGADILRDAVVVVDSREQARLECGDVAPLVESGELAWDALPELGELVAAGGKFHAGKPITVFESLGMGLLDIAVAGALVRKLARE